MPDTPAPNDPKDPHAPRAPVEGRLLKDARDPRAPAEGRLLKDARDLRAPAEGRLLESARDPRAQAVLDFWFGPPSSPDYGKPREEWFKKEPDFDAAIRHNFMTDYERARDGAYDHWQNTASLCLALMILLDQFPRNMFRDDPRAFTTDTKALECARHAVAAGFDRLVGETGRVFFYLPFEHSENLTDQERSMALTRALTGWEQPGSPFQYASRHYEIIRRFGRFPHRNHVLGRTNTLAEAEFLTLPDSGF